jgi:hypothetical protein
VRERGRERERERERGRERGREPARDRKRSSEQRMEEALTMTILERDRTIPSHAFFLVFFLVFFLFFLFVSFSQVVAPTDMPAESAAAARRIAEAAIRSFTGAGIFGVRNGME